MVAAVVVRDSAQGSRHFVCNPLSAVRRFQDNRKNNEDHDNLRWIKDFVQERLAYHEDFYTEAAEPAAEGEANPSRKVSESNPNAYSEPNTENADDGYVDVRNPFQCLARNPSHCMSVTCFPTPSSQSTEVKRALKHY